MEKRRWVEMEWRWEEKEGNEEDDERRERRWDAR